MPALYSGFRALSLAAIIAVGIVAVWFLVVFTTCTTLEGQPGHAAYEQLQIRVDGTPVILKYSRDYPNSQVLTTDLQPASGGLHQLLPTQSVIAAAREVETREMGRSWQNRLAAVSDGATPANYWYLIHDGRPNGLAYGVGYSTVTKQVVGYFSRAGFSDKLPERDTWFQVPGTTALVTAVLDRSPFEPYYSAKPTLYVQASNRLWEIDTRGRRVTSLFESPEIVSLGWAWRTLDQMPKEDDGPIVAASSVTPQSLVVRLPDEIVLIDPKTRRKVQVPLPKELRSTAMSITQLADGRILVTSYDPSSPAVQTLSWLTAAGEIAEQRRVAVAPPMMMNARTGMTIFAIGAPAIVWQIPIHASMAWSNWRQRKSASLSAATFQALSDSWPGLLLIVLVSAAAAVAAYRRQRRLGLPGAARWAAFVFLFGPAGWLAYRWHRSWPPVDDCPSCDHLSPRDRPRCLECGSIFPAPELKGTEVFA